MMFAGDPLYPAFIHEFDYAGSLGATTFSYISNNFYIVYGTIFVNYKPDDHHTGDIIFPCFLWIDDFLTNKVKKFLLRTCLLFTVAQIFILTSRKAGHFFCDLERFLNFWIQGVSVAKGLLILIGIGMGGGRRYNCHTKEKQHRKQ